MGVGPGTITVDFAERLTDGSVVGIDSAPTAVSATRTLAAEQGVENLSVSVGDVYHLQFPDASFEVVHAHRYCSTSGTPLRPCARWVGCAFRVAWLLHEMPTTQP